MGGSRAVPPPTSSTRTLLPRWSEIRDAYLEQCELIEAEGATVVVMASRQLAAAAERVGRLPQRSTTPCSSGRARPVILHWLGEVFDPALAGYWGCADPVDSIDVVADLIADHRGRVDGIKVSLLDAGLEVALRRRLPDGVRLYTGDDFNFPELIRGDAHGASDALLGVFDAIAPVAAAALRALDDGDPERFDRPARSGRTPRPPHVRRRRPRTTRSGVVFLAYLNGSPGPFPDAGRDRGRPVDRPPRATCSGWPTGAGALADPERAARRFRPLLAARRRRPAVSAIRPAAAQTRAG